MKTIRRKKQTHSANKQKIPGSILGGDTDPLNVRHVDFWSKN